MNPAQRKIYFRLWTAACDAQNWDPKDDTQRHAITGSCMQCIHREPGDPRAKIRSTVDLDQKEITALFVFLQHLGAPSDPVISARWLEVQKDYKSFNLARNADWFQGVAGYTGKSRIVRDRFAGRRKAQPAGFESELPADESAAKPYSDLRKRLITMSVRARDKVAAQKAAAKHAAEAAPQPLCTAPAGGHAEPPQTPVLQPAGHDPDEDSGSPFW